MKAESVSIWLHNIDQKAERLLPWWEINFQNKEELRRYRAPSKASLRRLGYLLKNLRYKNISLSSGYIRLYGAR